MNPEEDRLDQEHTERVRLEVLQKRREEYIELISHSSPEDIATIMMGKDERIKDQDGQLAKAESDKERLEQLAMTDSLTGLPNELQFNLRLANILSTLKTATHKEGHRESDVEAAETQAWTVLFCDLLGFKEINDRLTHAQGDLILIQVATHIRKQLHRDGDMAFRLHGDEFVVLLKAKLAQSDVVIDRIRKDCPAGISIGAFQLDPNKNAVDNLKEADKAMYINKADQKAGR